MVQRKSFDGSGSHLTPAAGRAAPASRIAASSASGGENIAPPFGLRAVAPGPQQKAPSPVTAHSTSAPRTKLVTHPCSSGQRAQRFGGRGAGGASEIATVGPETGARDAHPLKRTVSQAKGAGRSVARASAYPQAHY